MASLAVAAALSVDYPDFFFHLSSLQAAATMGVARGWRKPGPFSVENNRKDYRIREMVWYLTWHPFKE